MPYTKPNFFIVGAPKCGTTSLSVYLASHPDVYFSPVKEPHFWADDFKGRPVSTLKHYLNLFENANPERHLAVGEGSTTYLYSKTAIPNIVDFQPGAKIIVMVRNPIDMVISLHAQRLGLDGVETIRSFDEAWLAEKARKQGRHVPITCPDPKYLYYSEWGKLGTQLQRAIAVLPDKQIKVILFDDFVKKTREVYVDTLKFLGLSDDNRTEFPPVNERRSPRNLVLHRALSTVARFWMPVRRKLLGGRGLGLFTSYYQWNSFLPKTDVSLRTRQMLLAFYRDEIKLLESLLGRNLEHWNLLS